MLRAMKKEKMMMNVKMFSYDEPILNIFEYVLVDITLKI